MYRLSIKAVQVDRRPVIVAFQLFDEILAEDFIQVFERDTSLKS